MCDYSGDTRPLLRLFNAVAGRYDLMNRILTFGLDRRWRAAAAEEMFAHRPARILDLCCGTGDLLVNILRRSGADADIYGVDFSRPMLDKARKKITGIPGAPCLVQADVRSLPFPDGFFDAVGTAFAFRNLTYRNRYTKDYLAEIYRVLSSTGKFVIVESSQPRSRAFRAVFHAYASVGIKKIGGIIAGEPGAYSYFAESAKNYYDADGLCVLLSDAGFVDIRHRPLFFGVAALTCTGKSGDLREKNRDLQA